MWTVASRSVMKMKTSMPWMVALSVAFLAEACSSDEGDDGSGASSSSSAASVGGGGEAGTGGTGVGGEGAGAGGHAGGQGGAAAQGGAGGAGGQAYDGVACLNCIDPLVKAGQQCERVFASCEGDAPCAAWLECTEDCFQPGAPASCWDACDTTHADAARVFGPFYDCFCDDCAAVCGTACD
jgi:hypothetical protein